MFNRVTKIAVLFFALLVCDVFSDSCAFAQSKKADRSTNIKNVRPKLKTEKHRVAIERGIALLRSSVDRFPSHRDCFSCHHQSVPLLTLSFAMPKGKRARQSAFAVQDKDRVQAIVDQTKKSFLKQAERLKSGEEVESHALAVGHGLWALHMAHEPPSELTDSMVEYLIRTQEKDGRWRIQSIRTPAASSEFMSTAMALYGIAAYGPPLNSDERIRDAVFRSTVWFQLAESPRTTEDWVGLGWGLRVIEGLGQPTVSFGGGGADGDYHPKFPLTREWLSANLSKDQLEAYRRLPEKRTLRTVSNELWKIQHDDGSWGQALELAGDAYSTGIVSVLLKQIDRNYKQGIAVEKLNYGRGIEYLINTQLPDGSWHVHTRSTPIQEYFDNGDPHEKDQFISILATAWSTAALLDAWHQTGWESFKFRDGRNEGQTTRE